MLTATLLMQIIATSASLFMCIMTICGVINWSKKNKRTKRTEEIDKLQFEIAYIEKEITDLRNKPINADDQVLANLIQRQIDAREEQLQGLKEELKKLTK